MLKRTGNTVSSEFSVWYREGDGQIRIRLTPNSIPIGIRSGETKGGHPILYRELTKLLRSAGARAPGSEAAEIPNLYINGKLVTDSVDDPDAREFEWIGTEWIPDRGLPVRPCYWVVAVRNPDDGKVYNSRFTNGKHTTATSAAEELYGRGGMTPNMYAYCMTGSIGTARRLMKKLPF